MKKIKASILIANFNNAKYIDKCIRSLEIKNLKNIEIIFHDDCSTDNSLEIINKYKHIKLIKNKVRYKEGSYNQILAYERCFKKSRGEIIFFLDSDDYFKKNKINSILNYYNNNPDINSIFDLPIIDFNNRKTNINIKKKFYNSTWPYIPPQSCISMRRKIFPKILKKIKIKKYFNIWMDFRIALYTLFISSDFFILKKNLTFYRQTNTMESVKFKFLSNNWWKRRLEAHKYSKEFLSKNKIKYEKTLDFYVTKFINYFI